MISNECFAIDTFAAIDSGKVIGDHDFGRIVGVDRIVHLCVVELIARRG